MPTFLYIHCTFSIRISIFITMNTLIIVFKNNLVKTRQLTLRDERRIETYAKPS